MGVDEGFFVGDVARAVFPDWTFVPEAAVLIVAGIGTLFFKTCKRLIQSKHCKCVLADRVEYE